MSPRSPLNRKQLEEIEFRLRAVKSSLPEEHVRDLAHEVLRRVALRNAAPPKDFRTSNGFYDQIDHLAFALIDDDRDADLAFIQAIQRTGATIEELYLVFLAEAARRLGEWWQQDSISLTDVTMGTARIFSILHTLDASRPRQSPMKERFALFASVPGETHTLGVRMATDIFRREGWSIELLSGLSHDALVARAEAMEPEIIGLSAGGEVSFAPLARLVLALRISQPAARILVSGHIVTEIPHRIADLSPDGMAATLEEARTEIERLWSGAGSARSA